MKQCLMLSVMMIVNIVAFSQIEDVPIKQELKNVTIVEFKDPFKEIEVMVEKNSRYSVLGVTDKTIFRRDRKNTYSLSDLKQGMRVIATIDYFQTKNTASVRELVLDSKYYGSVSLEGIFEELRGDVAFIDGQAVKLSNGKKIKGVDGWKEKTFGSFAEMQLGGLVKIRGKREIEGYISAESGTVAPVLSSDDDRLLRRAMGLAMKVTRTNISIGKKNLTLVTDLKVQDYINQIGMSLVPKYMQKLGIDHPDKIDFKFYIVNDEEINAAAYPDGTAIINTGLLKAIENEAQLAAIIGHEITHVIYGHHANRMKKTGQWKNVPTALGVTAGAATGSAEIGAATLMLTEAVGDMSKQSFSRKKESQADRVGLYYMTTAGYDPREGMKFWKHKLMKELEEKEDQEAKKQGRNLALNLSGSTKIEDENDDQETKETATLSTYDPNHPKVIERFNNMNYLLATSYASTDFTKFGEQNIGRVKYKMIILDRFNSKPKSSPKAGTKAKGTKPKKKS